MKTDSNGLAVFFEAAQGVKAHYHAPYAMPSLIAEAGARAPKLKRAETLRTRNRLTVFAVVVLIIFAGCTIRIPASSSAILARFAPDIKPNVWQALSIFAFSGMHVNSQADIEDSISTSAEQAYNHYAAAQTYRMFKDMQLPEDIRKQIGCSITQDYYGPDPLRARGKRGGISKLGMQIRIDQAQFGWRPIRDQLASIGEFPLNSKVKQFDELTESEKALIAPLYDAQPYLGSSSIPVARGEFTVDLLCGAALNLREKQLTANDLVYMWLGATAFSAKREATKVFTKPETDRWLARNFMLPVTSPVTGKLFEPNHSEFSRGNGFITEITNPRDVTTLKASLRNANLLLNMWNSIWTYVEAPAGYDWDGLERFDKCRWFYFRLYGEESVIAEGVYLSSWEEGYWLGPTAAFTRPTANFPATLYVPWDMRDDGLPRQSDNWRQAFKPAPDYDTWLASQSKRDLADIVWSIGDKTGQNLTPRRQLAVSKESRICDVEDLRKGIIQGLMPGDIGGLPTQDPLKAQQDLEAEEVKLISDTLGGDKSAIGWFADTKLGRITSQIDWVLAIFTLHELREIARAYSVGGYKGASDKAKSYGRPGYTAGVGGIFLPIYRDFEPYQGYFERVDTPALRGKAREQLGKEPKDMIYFRIYGAERVIAEGVWVR
jgi:hypothetical protein